MIAMVAVRNACTMGAGMLGWVQLRAVVCV
jgi:hypothetical protein